MNELVKINDNNQVTTDSQTVADRFGKRHCDVLRSIKMLKCSKEFTERNFAFSEYLDNTGRKLPCYDMTRDGWMFLVMGFTGERAAEWKEKFISAFNRMEATVRENRTIAAPAVNEDLKDWCAQALALMIENRVRMAVDEERDRIAEQLKLCLTRGNPE